MIAFRCSCKFFVGKNKKSSFDRVLFRMNGDNETEVSQRIEKIAEFMCSGTQYGFFDMGAVIVSKPKVLSEETKKKMAQARKRRAQQA